jgi:hypothetical protein
VTRRWDSVDFETLLGEKCLLNVVHDEKTATDEEVEALPSSSSPRYSRASRGRAASSARRT